MRTKRIGIVVGISVAMLLVGGIGLLTNTKPDATAGATAQPAPVRLDASPAEILAALQTRLASFPKDSRS